ncbi:PAS domain-containing sensor histidine kinase [Flavobacterium phycosphaerae]|uniref:PAS domain-containing sensor histidine kinase n=1 Tax=Flavobacterium phycosphaerae TaxID=2697515 RepID=UPI00138B164D|nr:PAS domain-containing sensor histidine kinase [Flavobacterium phycosphaerae]
MPEIDTYLNKTYKMGLFFELSADLFIIAGFDGYFKKVNPAVCKVLEYSEAELLAHPITTFIHEDDLAITIKNRENIKMGKPLLHFENRYVTKSGETVWLSWTSMPLVGSDLVYAIAKNITHIKKQEEERNLLLTNLKKINRDLKKLNYTASHDMRSPVNNLLSIFSLLDVSTIKDKETLEFIEILKTSTEGLKQTLNNYVDNIHHNENQSIALENISFEKSLKKVQQSIKSLVKDSKTTFTIDFSLAKKVTFNKTYLESIFLNLITNAIKYGNPDKSPNITITTQKIEGYIQLIFTDNGQGFDIKKVKDKIFGLNQKFHNNADSKGIGLYLVYNHITDLGGTIEVKSEIDKGTTFTLLFRD